MRTRSKARTAFIPRGLEVQEYPYPNGNPNTPWQTVIPPSTVNITPYVSEITDNADRSISGFKPCYHRQEWISTNADPTAAFTGDFPRYYGVLRISVKGALVTLAGDSISNAGTAWASYSAGSYPDWQSFAAEAKQRMLPSLNDGSSLVNFIIELRDFKRLAARLFRSISHAGSFKLPNVQDIREIWWEAWGRKPWDSKPRQAASAYLSWKLAWQPFVNDCRQLLERIFRFREKVKEFERRQKQRQQRYYGKSFPIEPPGGLFQSDWSSWTSPDHYAVKVRRKRQETGKNECRLTATMRYRYILPPMFSALVNSFESYLDILGISRNPAILWNAVPFSFVVDWFVNIGGFLESLREDNVQAVTTVSAMSVSIRSERNFVEETQLGLQPNPVDTLLEGPISGVAVRKVLYERHVIDVPNSIGILSTGKGLIGSRPAIAAALALTNAPRIGKPRRGLYPQVRNGTTAAGWLGINPGVNDRNSVVTPNVD